MKSIKIILLLAFVCFGSLVKAQNQDPFDKFENVLTTDDSVKLAVLVNKTNINDCYVESPTRGYSLLSETIRYHASKCFDWLIANGADVNKSCNGYVPPLMHAAKYGTLDMVKKLVAKGANINYKYSGDYQPADGQTPLTYAELYKQAAIVDYLKSLNAK